MSGLRLWPRVGSRSTCFGVTYNVKCAAFAVAFRALLKKFVEVDGSRYMLRVRVDFGYGNRMQVSNCVQGLGCNCLDSQLQLGMVQRPHLGLCKPVQGSAIGEQQGGRLERGLEDNSRAASAAWTQGRSPPHALDEGEGQS